MKLFFSLLFTLITVIASAQNFKDSIILLNGVSFMANNINLTEGILKFDILNEEGTPSSLEITQSRIFSYHQNNKETVLYQANPLIIDDFKPFEMRRYVVGAYDARETYHGKTVFWTSMALAYGVSLWDTYLTPKAFDPVQFPNLNAGFFGKKPTMIQVLSPLVFTASFAFPKIKVKDKYLLHKNFYGDKMYYYGFNGYTRKKRIFAALKGSAIGVGLGLITYSILKIN